MTDGWTPLPDLPGTPRFMAAQACIGDYVYVIGGCSNTRVRGDPSRTDRAVIDNWRLHVPTRRWERLPDSPVSNGNWGGGAVYRGRYMILPGGAAYKHVSNEVLDVGTAPPAPISRHSVSKGFSDGVLVFDTVRHTFEWSDPLPMPGNGGMGWVHGDYFYLLGGEGGVACAFGDAHGIHLDTVLRAKITLGASSPRARQGGRGGASVRRQKRRHR